MSDRHMRELERRFKETGADADLNDYLRELARQGAGDSILDDEELKAGLRRRLRAFLGEAAYRRLLKGVRRRARFEGSEPRPEDTTAWNGFVQAELPGLSLTSHGVHVLCLVCPVHDAALEEGEAEIWYGLIYPPDGFYEVETEQFPCSNQAVLGGCVIDEERTMAIHYCLECRARHRAWSQESGISFLLAKA